MRISEYRAVWVCVMFDLPTTTKTEKRNYARFRKNLKKDGFTMLQFSVYVRHCASGENGIVHQKRVKAFLPPNGKISIITVTDKQYSSMVTYWGRKQQPGVEAPKQLELF